MFEKTNMNGYQCIVFLVIAASAGIVTSQTVEPEALVTVLPTGANNGGDEPLPWFGPRPGGFGNNGINQNNFVPQNQQWRGRQRQFGNVNQASAGFPSVNANRFGNYGYPNFNSQYNPGNTNFAYPAFQDPRAAYYNSLYNPFAQNFRQFA